MTIKKIISLTTSYMAPNFMSWQFEGFLLSILTSTNICPTTNPYEILSFIISILVIHVMYSPSIDTLYIIFKTLFIYTDLITGSCAPLLMSTHIIDAGCYKLIKRRSYKAKLY